jgi:hypothetical protein
MAATIRDVLDGRIFVTLTRNVNRGLGLAVSWFILRLLERVAAHATRVF